MLHPATILIFGISDAFSRYGPEYAIYSTSAHDPFVYEQPMPIQLSDFDDTSSVTTYSAYSPALSTDSTMALKSPVGSESVFDDADTPTSDSSGNFSYDMPVQHQTPVHRSQENSIAINRTATPFRPGETNSFMHAFHPANLPIELLEYDPSTISEVEVEERDRVAKMNAKYNAVTSSSYSSSDVTSSQDTKQSNAPSRPTNVMQRQMSSQVGSTRLSSSRPLHPDLHFPQRRLGNEVGHSSTDFNHNVSTSIQNYASRDMSPPSVERVSSQLPLEENNPQSKTKGGSQISPPSDNRKHDTFADANTSSNSPRTLSQTSSAHQAKITSSPTLSPSSRSGHTKSANVSPQGILRDVSRGNKAEQTRDRAHSVSSPDLSRDRNLSERSPSTSVTKAGSELEYHTLALNKDKADNYQHQSSPMTAKRVSELASSIHKNASPPYEKYNSQSSPRRQAMQATELDENQRVVAGLTPRNDNKTSRSQRQNCSSQLDELQLRGHWPSGGQSYTQPTPSTTSKEVRSSPESRKENFKSGPLILTQELQRATSQFESVDDHERSTSTCNFIRPAPQNSSFVNQKQNSPQQEPKDVDTDRNRNRRLHNDRRTEPAVSNQMPNTDFPIDLSQKQNPSRPSKSYIDSRPYGFPSQETPYRHSGDERVYISSDTNWYDNSLSTSSDLASKSIQAAAAAPNASEPHRRYSDGDQNSPPNRSQLSGRISVPLVRSVRWTENLIAPSPVLASAKRIGWFNRRG